MTLPVQCMLFSLALTTVRRGAVFVLVKNS